MKIIDRLREDGIHISFEIFPPKTDAGYDKVCLLYTSDAADEL